MSHCVCVCVCVFRSFEGLDLFVNLRVLILDDNRLRDITIINIFLVDLPNLETLSLNKNQVLQCITDKYYNV